MKCQQVRLYLHGKAVIIWIKKPIKVSMVNYFVSFCCWFLGTIVRTALYWRWDWTSCSVSCLRHIIYYHLLVIFAYLFYFLIKKYYKKQKSNILWFEGGNFHNFRRTILSFYVFLYIRVYHILCQGSILYVISFF